MRPFSLVLFGPTASGKTDFSLELARVLPVEIINGDAGQFYAPLTIGTAKPDWQNQAVKHHLFDVLDVPIDYSAFQYREACVTLIDSLCHRARMPFFVGGSGFYLKSLFFPLRQPHASLATHMERTSEDLISSEHSPHLLWDLLAAIDPARAQAIHPNDQYKINRALDIWRQTGVTPSLLKPVFEPIAKNNVVIFLDRDREDIDRRVSQRLDEMIKGGWIDEVRALPVEWRSFLEKRRLIGYAEIFAVLDGTLNKDEALKLIRIQTLQYIKRQRTFWRSFKKSLIGRGVQVKELNLSSAQVNAKAALVSFLSKEAERGLYESKA